MAVERALCPVLIGREEELSELEDALLAARRGEGRVVLLAGDAGMGKTRLAKELAARAGKVGMEVLWGGCSEAELALPYLPFLEALGNYLATAELEAVRTRLGPVRRELAHLFPQLEPEGVPADVDSTQGKLRLFEAILALLAIPAAERGLLLVVEDLHWADGSTRELFDYMTRRLRSARILILATYRRDEMHRRHPLLPMLQAWRRSASTASVELEPLDGPRVAQMVRAIFDIREVRDETSNFLLERTEGNPFVLEEMLKVAVDRGDIFRTETGWERKALAEMRMPDTVRDTILLRLDRLSAEHVEVLRAAAVLGASFGYEDLLAVTQMDEPAVQQALEASVRQQLLEADPRTPRAYRFRHALTREAIYEDVILPQRERLHARAAEHFQARDGRPVEISHHLLAAGRGAEALPLCLRAAEEAKAAYAFGDAAELYRRALPFLEPGPERAALLCQLGVALQAAGQPASALGYLEEGIAGLQAGAQSREGAAFRLILGRCYWELARSTDAQRAYEEARAVLEAMGPSADLALAYVRLAGMQLFQFDSAGCIDLARKAIELAESCGADAERIWAYNFLGGGLAMADDPSGIQWLDRSFEEARAAGLYTIAGNALWNGIMMRLLGDRILELPARLDLMRSLPLGAIGEMDVEFALGFAAMFDGRPVESLEHYSAGGRIARELGTSIWELRARIWVAAQLVALERLQEAAQALPDRALLTEAQERSGRTATAIELQLALGDNAAAAREAEALFEMEGWDPGSRGQVAAPAARAFLAAGDLAELRRLPGLLGDARHLLARSARAQVDACLCLAEGRPEEAALVLQAWPDELREQGYVKESMQLHLLLAEAQMAAGRSEDAVRLLQDLFAYAGARGCRLVVRQAGERLAALGAEPRLPEFQADFQPGAVGERLVTVLFADVRGYTGLVRALPPAEAADRIAALQRWAAQEIERRRGVVDKFAGDAVMATFNVSGASTDHAVAALRAALALRDKAAAQGLPLGVGIATGAAVVGALAEGANLSVIGTATNLAARLQSAAGAGEIMLDLEAQRRVAGWASENGVAAELCELELKGFEEPIRAFRVEAPSLTSNARS